MKTLLRITNVPRIPSEYSTNITKYDLDPPTIQLTQMKDFYITWNLKYMKHII